MKKINRKQSLQFYQHNLPELSSPLSAQFKRQRLLQSQQQNKKSISKKKGEKSPLKLQEDKFYEQNLGNDGLAHIQQNKIQDNNFYQEFHNNEIQLINLDNSQKNNDEQQYLGKIKIDQLDRSISISDSYLENKNTNLTENQGNQSNLTRKQNNNINLDSLFDNEKEIMQIQEIKETNIQDYNDQKNMATNELNNIQLPNQDNEENILSNTFKARDLLKINDSPRNYNFSKKQTEIQVNFKGNQFLGWHKMYIVVKDNERILFYNDEQILQKTFCFQLFKTEIFLENLVILINVVDYQRKLAIKFSSTEMALKYTQIFEFCQKYYIENYSIDKKWFNQYYLNNAVCEDDFINQVETGDLILMKTDNFQAQMQSYFTRSKYDHIGIIYKNKQRGYVYVFDSLPGVGVRKTEWINYIHRNNLFFKVMYRPLIFKDKYSNKFIQILEQFMEESIGTTYDWGIKKMLRKNSFQFENKFDQNYGNVYNQNTARQNQDYQQLQDISRTDNINNKNLLQLNKNNNDNNIQLKSDKNNYKLDNFKIQNQNQQNQEGVFCSELVAKFFKKIGIIDKDKQSTSYWPVHFTEKRNLQLQQGATLGQETIIVLDRHVIQNQY